MIDLIHGDCLEEMKKIKDNSIDMILCDLPYGTTICKWDIVIDFNLLWEQYKRIIKDNAAIVLFGSQPFTSRLVCSNITWFKYEWIWEKAVGSNFAILKYQPMKEHENILVFSKKKHKYRPIKQPRKGSGSNRVKYKFNATKTGEITRNKYFDGKIYDKNLRNPSSVQFFNNREKNRGLHPTQKPIALLEYLIKTYTDKDDLILDNCMGSGSTGIAAKNLKRSFIGIEKDERYYKIAKERIKNHRSLL